MITLANMETVTYDIEIENDEISEPVAEEFMVAISGTGVGSTITTATVTITDNDGE